MGPDPTFYGNILLTGVPGCGKTTLLRKLAQALKPFHPVGFYTEEIRIAGRRQGFRLVGFQGGERILAHVNLSGGPRVGKYGVDVAGLERFLEAQRLDQVDAPLVLIDEIGRMECLSHRFVHLIRTLLQSPSHLVATVALKGGGFMAEVKDRPDVSLVKVGLHNRDRLVQVLSPRIASMLEA